MPRKKKTTTIRAFPADAAFFKDVAHYENKNIADVAAEGAKLLRSRKKGIPVRQLRGV